MRAALRSRRVVTPEGVREAAVVFEAGRVVGVAAPDRLPPTLAATDLGDLVLMPGLVDTHVHINAPGRGDWEDFASGTRAAAAGGLTTLVVMPLNSHPVTTTAAALDAKRAEAGGRCRVDVGFHGGLIAGNAGELEALVRAGVLGIKAFLVPSGIDEFPPARESDLRAAMPRLAAWGVPLLVHAELDEGEAPALADPRRYADYLASRPRLWERRAIEGMVALCAEYGGRVHIVHLSDADSVPLLQSARARGLPLTVETGPHYLSFGAEDIADGDTRFKCAPPIRERENRERLWDALRAGAIDMIASDHSPSPPALKRAETGDFGQAWGGISSLQLVLPVVWTGARARGFGLADVAWWLCLAPARSVGLAGRKGVIAPGADADFVVWDPEASFPVTPERLHHRHPMTPYAGLTLYGAVRQTWLRGVKVFEDGEFLGPPAGALLRREG